MCGEGKAASLPFPAYVQLMQAAANMQVMAGGRQCRVPREG